MMVTGSRMRQIGWLASLGLCVAIFAVLSFNVHAVKSEVLLAERKIVSLERETMLLETEFQTRASQRQLATWNAVEFGYDAPRADQYLESEQQLADYGQPQVPGSPAPIRVARAENAATNQSFEPNKPRQAMVSPLTGEPITLASANAELDATASFTEAFGELIAEASPIGAANAAETAE